MQNVPDIPDKTNPSVTPPKPDKPVATFNAIAPTPTKIVKKEEPAPTISKYDTGKAGIESIAGEKPNETYTPSVIQGPTVSVPPEKPAPTRNKDEIVVKADVDAKFSGGLEVFRKKVGENFDISDFEGSGERITTMVTFVVERDGSISAVKGKGKDAAFNREAERAVKSVKGKWTPAILEGETVRSYFQVPVTIQFE